MNWRLKWPKNVSLENHVSALIFGTLVWLSFLAAVGFIFKISFVGILHVVQVTVPLIAVVRMLRRWRQMPRYQWLLVPALLLLAGGDAAYYVLFYYWNEANKGLTEFLGALPYLVAYALMTAAIAPFVLRTVRSYHVRFTAVSVLVPLLLWGPTLKAMLSVPSVDLPLVIAQTILTVVMMACGLLLIIVARSTFLNTLALGLFCLGLSDLSISIEHFFSTVAVESINTYVWTLASVTFCMPFLFADSTEPAEFLPDRLDSLVLNARLWLISGVTIPVALFSLLGKEKQVIAFTSLTILLVTIVVYIFTTEFLKHLERTSAILKNLDGDLFQNFAKDAPWELREGLINVVGEHLRMKTLQAKSEMDKALEVGRIASQVSHDIRSPISALNLLLVHDQQMAENKRLIVRHAVNRINDIANDLLNHSKQRIVETEVAASFELLSALIDPIVSEKRIRFYDRQEVKIEFNQNECYGLFVKVVASEFKRAISNLLENAIEALADKGGKVEIAVTLHGQSVMLRIRDNGKGIPDGVLKRVGEFGFTHGKQGTASGSGLGVHHAIKTMEAVGGSLRVDSQLGLGSEVTIELPHVEAPAWFLGSLKIPAGTRIAVVDDDLGIHEVWRARFNSVKDVQLVHFSSTDSFAKWIATERRPTDLFFIDQEFVNQSLQGTELIEQIDGYSQSILVTSRYLEVADWCTRSGVKLIPKHMAASLPLDME